MNDQPSPPDRQHLTRSDVLLLAGYCALLFGVAVVSGRPLTLHECVLPQSARAMLADRDFVVPKIDAKRPIGDVAEMPVAPWLESPPLPQWITVAIALPFGRCDTESIVRIGPVLVGIGVVLLVAWMTTVWYGRWTGVLSGFVMATTFQFTRYCWLAEDEIYLCGIVTAVMALFVKLEWGFFVSSAEGQSDTAVSPDKATPNGQAQRVSSVFQECLQLVSLKSVFGPRGGWVVAFFVLLGMTNLVKGLVFGTVMSLVPIGGYLLLTGQPRRWAKYVWFWGAALFLVVMLAWPLAVSRRYPDVLALWHCDLFGRISGQYTDINQPWYYYGVNLFWIVAPWTIAIPFGLWATRSRVWQDRCSPERFLWCWAFFVPAFFSIPGGKHHHYLLHAVAPWAILATLGLAEWRRQAVNWPRWLSHPLAGAIGFGVPAGIALALFGQKLSGPSWLPLAAAAVVALVAAIVAWSILHPRAERSAGVVFTLLLLGYVAGHCYAGRYLDSNRDDIAFLKRVRQRSDVEQLPVLVDMTDNPFHGLMGLFHQRGDARLLHNISFVGAAEITEPEVLIVALGSLEPDIAYWGDVARLDQSPRIPRGLTTDERLTLFRLRYRTDMSRRSANGIRISPMQAMHRDPGPFLSDKAIAEHTILDAGERK